MRARVKLHLEILVMLVVIGTLFTLGMAGFDTLSGLRAYVGGEALWAKGQKEATYQLSRYVYMDDEDAYLRFHKSLAGLLGDRSARMEMNESEPRREIIEQGLLLGGNHPEDIPMMITLYRLFNGVGDIKKAVNQWAIGDELIAELIDLGAEIHEASTGSGLDPTRRNEYSARIDELQGKLYHAETLFSQYMSTASRQAEYLLMAVMALFSALGGVVCIIMLRMIGGIIIELRTNNDQLKAQAEVEETIRLELRNSEERFRRLAENAPDAIYRKALPSGTYEYMSPAAMDVFGYSPKDFYTTPQLIRKLMHPDWREYYETQWSNLVAGTMPPFYEYRIIHGSGEIRWLNQRNVLIRDEAGQPIAIEGVVTDITEQKAWEAEREQLAQKLRQSHKMEAVGTLAGGIAHDFNNILSSILGHAELTRLEVADDSPAAQYLNEVLSASIRAKDLIRRILAFSSGEVQEREPLHVQAIVEETISLMRASLPTTVAIEAHMAMDCGAVLAEPTQIHQVIMNLCTNAAQAMGPSGGRLDVYLDEVDLAGDDMDSRSALAAGRYVRLTVSDTGPGIDPQIRERIFDPYFTTKPIGRGTGMGLSVVHGIVTSYGGAISVASEPDAGATFHVYLPRIGSVVKPQPGKAAGLLVGGERILFVDDEPSLVRMNKKRFERLGFSVTAVESSRDALDLFRADPDAFDLVITDQTMPEMTGGQLSIALLELRPDLPIILCTGFSETLSEEQAHELGIRAMILKPIESGEMMKVIRGVLDMSPLPS